MIVNVDGSRHEIREGDQRLTVMAIDHAHNRQIRKDYQFNLPSVEVGVRTYQLPAFSAMVAPIKANEPLAPYEEELISHEVRHISEFLERAQDPEYFRGKGPQWAELERACQKNERHDERMERIYQDGKQSRWLTENRGDFDDWKRREIVARGKKAARKKATRKVIKPSGKTVSLWGDSIPTQKEGEPHMAALITGTRARMTDQLGGDYVYGTAVELKEGLPKGYTLLCMDQGKPNYTDFPEVCMEGHGFLANTGNLRPGNTMRNVKALYRGVPPFVGVFAPEPFQCDGINFPRHSVGRLICLENDTATVSWKNVKDKGGNFWTGDDDEDTYPKCYHVPMDCLRWCWMDPKSYKIKRMWYTSQSPVATGDILVYNSDKPLAVTGDRHAYVITRGVLLRHQGWSSDKRSLAVDVVAGMAPEILGATVRVRKQDVRPFEGNFIQQGSEVEVVAEILFKKQDLQGRKGRVVLSTDSEGDVGVEFPEDIGAGSLDGAGKEGRCLYIPAESVEKTSE